MMMKGVGKSINVIFDNVGYGGDYLLIESRRDWARFLAMQEWEMDGETVE